MEVEELQEGRLRLGAEQMGCGLDHQQCTDNGKRHAALVDGGGGGSEEKDTGKPYSHGNAFESRARA